MRSAIVVDDNLDTLESFATIVDWSSLGFEFSASFDDSNRALQYIAEHQPDVAFCDVVMPSPTGLEILLSISVAQARTRVILISAHHEFEYVQDAIRRGAYDYVLKPIASERIAELLSRIAEDIEAEEEVQRRLREHLPLKQERILRNAIHGRVETATVFSGAQFPRPFLEGTCKRCLVARAVVPDDEDADSRQLDPAFFSEFEFAITQLVDRETARVIPLDEMAVAIVLSGGVREIANVCGRFVDGARDVEARTKQRFQLGLCLGLGSAVRSFDALHASFEKAMEAVERATYLGSGTTVDAETDLPDSTDAVDLPLEIEANIVRSLRVRAMPAFDRGFDRLVGALEREEVPRETAYAIMLSVYIRFLRSIGLQTSGGSPSVVSVERLSRSLWRAKRQHEAIRVFTDTVRLLVEPIRRASRRNDELIAERARGVVEENFADSTLSVAGVADALRLSPNYLSSLFKKATGTNLTDCIAEVRLEAAAGALKDSDALIYEIAERVGFASQYHFSARFKKRFGLTPVQYRRLHSGRRKPQETA